MSAEQVHNTLMALVDSNFAAVATTPEWVAAVTAGTPPAKDDLLLSSIEGRNVFGG
ncbi:hypothetical protein [Gordonia aurantiaca]